MPSTCQLSLSEGRILLFSDNVFQSSVMWTAVANFDRHRTVSISAYLRDYISDVLVSRHVDKAPPRTVN